MIFLIGIEKNHPKISMEVQKAPSRQTNPEQIAMLLKKNAASITIPVSQCYINVFCFYFKFRGCWSGLSYRVPS
jgi:hypothetical protein